MESQRGTKLLAKTPLELVYILFFMFFFTVHDLGTWFSRVICMCLHTALLLWFYLMYIMYCAWLDTAHHLFPKTKQLQLYLSCILVSSCHHYQTLNLMNGPGYPPPKISLKCPDLKRRYIFRGPSFLGFYLSFRERTSSQRYLTTFEFLGFSQGWFLMPWGKRLWYIYIYMPGQTLLAT